MSAPAPAGQREADAQVARMRTRLEAAVSLPQVQAQILLKLRARLEELAKDRDHSREWLERRQVELRAEAAKALDDAEAAAADALGEVHEAARKATTREPGSAQDQILEQMQLQNAWLSTRQILDAAVAAKDPIGALEAAVASASEKPGGLAALKFFMGDWLQASGRPQREQGLIRDALRAGIEAAEAPLRTPVEAAGHTILQEVERGRARLSANSAEVRGEIASYDGRQRAAALAGWDDSGHILFRDAKGEFPREAITAAFGDHARAWEASAKRTYPLLSGQPTAAERQAAQYARLGMNVGGQEE